MSKHKMGGFFALTLLDEEVHGTTPMALNYRYTAEGAWPLTLHVSRVVHHRHSRRSQIWDSIVVSRDRAAAGMLRTQVVGNESVMTREVIFESVDAMDILAVP